jgi:predicted metalloprotease with PDZ domain
MLFILSSLLLFAQDIIYNVDMPNAKRHEINITLTVKTTKKEALHFRMSRSSPGRYALHEFAKNVYNVQIKQNGKLQETIGRPSQHEWILENAEGNVTFSYTFYANHGEGTYSGVRDNFLHLNIPATFVYVKEYQQSKILVNLNVPDDWKIATQLLSTGKNQVMAENLYYFMDSPIIAGKMDFDGFKVKDNNGEYNFALAAIHQDEKFYYSKYLNLVEAVVNEAKEVFGEYPKFDKGAYTFLAHFSPEIFGDGMEHRNSTMISSSNGIKKSGMDLLGTVSHEFFHAWNVERIRPKALEPFTFEDANMSAELWLAEGVTSYYDDLIIHRAGLTNIDDYVPSLANEINAVLLNPGRNYFSAAEMSMQAPFVDAAVSIEEVNRLNTYISYYTYGSAIGLGLDLTLRSKFNKTMDDLMRILWNDFGKTEIAYTNNDFKNSLAKLTNNDFAEKFYSDHIIGKKPIPFKELLNTVGYDLVTDKIADAWIGPANLKDDSKGLMLNGQVSELSPLYKTSIDKGEIIKSLNGETVKTRDELNAVLKKLKVGQEVELEFLHMDKSKKEKITLAGNPFFTVKSYEKLGKTTDSKQLETRTKWLAKKSTFSNSKLIKTCEECKRDYAFTVNFCPADGKGLNYFYNPNEKKEDK